MKLSQDRKTQLVIVTGFAILAYLFSSMVLLYLSLGLAVIFLVSKTLSRHILWLWWKIAHVLGWINTRILLSVVFYVFLLPIALLSRVFKRDPLAMNWKKTGSSFVVRNHLYTAEDLENPW